MQEIDSAIAALTDTDIVLEYRNALAAILPSCVRLQLLASDDQPYDDFDRVAALLWQELVARTFEWKYGGGANLPAYGGTTPPAAAPYVAAATSTERFPFVEFVSNRAFGSEPLNAVVVFANHERQEIALREINAFELVRA